MSERRRDRKGRLLKDGEFQEPSGRYRYSYMTGGERKVIYSWRLVVTDPLPKGKRECIPLREQEYLVAQKKLLRPDVRETHETVMSLVLWYTENRKGVRLTTRTGYKTVCAMLAKEPFGVRKIGSVTAKEAKDFLTYLQTEKGYSYSSIHTIRGVLRGAFKEAVFNGWTLQNPFGEFSLKDAIENDSGKRDAMDQDTEKKLMDFIKEDKHFSPYHDAFYILLHTGMRVSEFCGLTFDDVDLDRKEIRIDHQLMRVGVNVYCEMSTKTKAGTRVLPISDDVCDAFRNLIANRVKPEKEPEVDGFKGFICLDKDGRPTVALHWEHRLTAIRRKYNSHYKDPLPHITPHVLRHTYCTRQALKGMNPKILQYLMGHSDISLTLGYYTHAKCDDARAEMERMMQKEEPVREKTSKVVPIKEDLVRDEPEGRVL